LVVSVAILYSPFLIEDILYSLMVRTVNYIF
jgi:hypothetical protein